MRNRLQQVLLFTYTQTSHLSYPCPPLRIPTKKKQSRHSHVDQVLIMIISVIVVYEQGVGLKSSITADTAFQKIYPAGVYQLSIIDVARTPISLSCYPS